MNENFDLGKHYIAVLADGTPLRFKFVGGGGAKIRLEDGSVILFDKLPPHRQIIEDIRSKCLD